ncbi:MAG: phosphotransferase [Burkholderiaceae bacterium]
MRQAQPLPTDPALPQLPLALDTDLMAGVFERLVRERRPELRVQACVIDRIKYRPRRNVAVSYRLRLHDGQGGGEVEQLVATRFCASGESERRFANAHARAPLDSVAGPAVSHVASLDLLATWWPNDSKLGTAAALLGGPPAARERVVGELVGALTGGRGQLASYTLALAQVVPEHRACARVDLSFSAESGAARQTRTVYVKADVELRGGLTHAVMQALRRSEAQREGRLLTARPVLWQSDVGLHWQMALPGVALLDAAPAVGAGASLRVGALLAALHSARTPAERCAGPIELWSRLQPVIQTLAAVEPLWEDELRGLERGLAEGADCLRGEAPVTLHGDLHPRNILVTAQRLGLIDLDSVCQGAAVLDLGDWVADVLYRAMLGGQDLGAALARCRSFLSGYVAGGGAPVSETALAWSTANSLVCQRAWRAVVNLKPGRYALVEPLLRTASAIQRAASIDAAPRAAHWLAA